MRTIQFSVNPHDTVPLSPLVFSHNLEHTRAAVNGGLSAQMLQNRKFAGMPQKNSGMSAFWFSIGEKILCQNDVPSYTRHICLEQMHRTHELQAQRVQNLTEGQLCGMGQQDLTLVSGKTYDMRVVVQSSLPLPLTVTLTDRAGTTEYARHTLPLSGGDWETFSFSLTPVSESGDTCIEDACIRFTFTRRAIVTFGVVSMLPADHFHELRRDVVEHLKAIGPAALRWPGGNFAGEYRWMDGLLPVDVRGPLQAYMENETQPFTNGFDFHEIGTDDFIALCREVGAEPFLTINLVWNTPEESAAWVEYCNGSADTKYGRMRAERGHAEPYRLRLWSLGNEMGYGHMEGKLTPASYAALARTHAEAMRRVSPDLTLFSSGPYPNESWANESAAALSDLVSHVSLHHYTHAPWSGYGAYDYSTDTAIRDTYREIADGALAIRERARKMRSVLDATGKKLHISFDEWNCWFAWYRPSCVSEGIFTAKTLHTLMQESAALDMPLCSYFQPVGEGAILVTPSGSRLTANGQIFAMMQAHKGGALCRTNAEDAAAATVQDGILTVTLVNDDYDTPAEFRWNLSGTVQEAWVLTAEDVTPHSYFTRQPLQYRTENGLSAVLPPHSAAILRIALE